MSPTGVHLEMQGPIIKNVDQYIYLGHAVKLGNEIQTVKIDARVALTFEKLQNISKNLKFTYCLAVYKPLDKQKEA